MKKFAGILFVTLGLAGGYGDAVGAAQTNQPWRVAEALRLPAWLSLSGTFRSRYESLDDQFRATRNGGDQIFVLRTTLFGAVHQGPLTMAGEMMDSRASLDDSGTPISTGIVNTAELLQGYVQWRSENLFAVGAKSEVKLGRFTMDVGSRRLVARNRYRNTINAFSGIDWQWRSAQGRQFRAFFTFPVNRLPNTTAALRDNDAKFDEEKDAIKFWGVYVADTLPWGDNGEVFYFGLDERDGGGVRTANRELTTIGFRIYRKPALNACDFQVESVLQFGESRSSSAATNVADLDHFAHFQHVELGYSFERAWRPRLILQYDYASGDDNPGDGDNERFSTLYGARRFDFGPTSIFGAFARANINSPALRLQFKPAPKFSSFIAYRAIWLASDRDAWTTSGVRDPGGNTDGFIGQQLEMRVRYDLKPSNVRLETGFAHLFAGEFMDKAPNANGQGDATYVYGQLALGF